MLTNLLMRDKWTAGLGKTNNHFIVHISGETTRSHKRIRQSITQGIKEYSSRESVVLRLFDRIVGV